MLIPKTILLCGILFGKIQAVLMLCISYLSIYLLALNFEQFSIFYISLLSLPLTAAIINDIFYKQGMLLNKTLLKVSSLLIIDCILLYIGIVI